MEAKVIRLNSNLMDGINNMLSSMPVADRLPPKLLETIETLSTQLCMINKGMEDIKDVASDRHHDAYDTHLRVCNDILLPAINSIKVSKEPCK